MSYFGENVRSARRARSMTQMELAELANISASFLSDIERGKKEPLRANRAAIAAALGCPEADLFVEREDTMRSVFDEPLVKSGRGRLGARTRLPWPLGDDFKSSAVALFYEYVRDTAIDGRKDEIEMAEKYLLMALDEIRKAKNNLTTGDSADIGAVG